MRSHLTALALFLAPVAAQAAPPQTSQGTPQAPQVTVAIGPELAAKAERYGQRDLDGLAKDLARAVGPAAAKGGFTRLDLTLEDARPNRPTFAMLSREPSLSINSISIGGAKITGVAYGPGGPQPLKSSWYETDLRQEYGVATWTDADRAFDFLAGELRRGRVPTAFTPGTPGPERSPQDLHDPWTRRP